MFSKFPFLTLLAGISLCLALGVPSRALGQCELKVPAPVFNADTIPSPPSQTAAWKPPATLLPETFVSATATLFDHGLGDPRDCEYRQVEVVSGSVWGGSVVCKIHGWVLPNKSANQTQRFGIGWNGLVYPLVSVGEPANLSGDVLQSIKQDENLRARYKIEHPDFPFFRLQHAVSEATSMSHEMLLPLKASLLLRLGHTDLAERVWSAWSAGRDGDDKDLYLILSREWAWALFDRAVTAHMRGDDKLSVLSARSLIGIQRTGDLTFLKPLTQLLADGERRLKDKANPLEEDFRIKNPQVPVDTLIQHLDEVVAVQRGQPGGVDLSDSEIVKALIAHGDAAVEPLLNVIENDTRLTRSVSFFRDFHFERHLIGVHEAAYAALIRILKTSDFGSGSEWETLRRGLDERRALAARIRQYLSSHKKAQKIFLKEGDMSLLV